MATPEGAELRHIRETGDKTLKLAEGHTAALSSIVDRVIVTERRLDGHDTRFQALEGAPSRWRRLLNAAVLVVVASGLTAAGMMALH